MLLPREARLAAKSARLELTARRLARELILRSDAEVTVGLISDELAAWRATLAESIAKLEIPDGARELCLRLVGDGVAQFVRSVEGLVGERGGEG